MQNLKLLIGVIGGTLVLVFAIAFLFSQKPAEQTPETFDLQTILGEQRHQRSHVIAGEELSEQPEETEPASESAKPGNQVIVTEFSDFQCPACGAAEPVLQSILNSYGDKVTFVYRHFPLESIHPNARIAAVASEVMSDQDLFFEYHDILLERQEDWAEKANATEMLTQYANELGVNTDTFEAGLKDSKYDDLVQADIDDGFRLGVNSTPTFFVNNKKVNINVLTSEIDAALAQ